MAIVGTSCLIMFAVDTITTGNHSTIIAISTPIGVGAIGIIRLSGSQSLSILHQLVPSKPHFKPRFFHYAHIINPFTNTPIDEACIVFFKGPSSFSGEDMVECHVHSSPYILKTIMQCAIQLGAVLAEKGEFTKRAFLNGKLNLTQAESIMDIISAKTALAHDVALNHLQGKLYQIITEIRQQLMRVLEALIASIDFPEEVDSVDRAGFSHQIHDQMTILEHFIERKDYGRYITAGVKCVIIGKPNVGKSSFLNAIAGCNRAIVSEFPGTTRDFIEIAVEMNGILCEWIDTAGLRDTQDPIESLGIERVSALIDQADFLFWMMDSTEPITEEDQFIFRKIADKKQVYVLYNKCDLPENTGNQLFMSELSWPIFQISVIKDHGLEAVKNQLIADISGSEGQLSVDFICNVRQLSCIQTAISQLKQLISGLNNGIMDDVALEYLHQAIASLSEINGDHITQEALEGIFTRFCVGK